MIGEATPDFRLRVWDGTEEVRSFTKAHLAGKIALVSFWDSSRPESLAQLRSLLELAGARASERKLVCVLVNEDLAPENPAGRRTLMDNVFRENKLDLPRAAAIKVGFDADAGG